MNGHKIRSEGYYAFEFGKSFAEANPYKTVEMRGDANVLSLQVEAIQFFNGWESRRKEVSGLSGYSLFLDDFRFPDWVSWVPLDLEQNWVIATHFYEFIEIIVKCGLPRLISFDYDLDRHNLPVTHLPYGNGLDCAKWLIDYCERNEKKFPDYVIHSSNPEGKKAIQELIWNFKNKQQ